jgi:hypothetical protein
VGGEQSGGRHHYFFPARLTSRPNPQALAPVSWCSLAYPDTIGFEICGVNFRAVDDVAAANPAFDVRQTRCGGAAAVVVAGVAVLLGELTKFVHVSAVTAT